MVTVTRLVRARRRAVYRALLELDAVAVWRVPQDMSCVISEFEPREGGTFRLSLTYATPARRGKSTDATDTYHGRFERLVPDTMVRETIEFETDDTSLQGAFTETITLADAPGGTDVVFTHEGLPAGIGLEDDERGCTLALEQLARLVEAVDHPAHEVRRFIVTTAHGPAWDGTRPIREQAEWDAHAAFMDTLAAEEYVLIAGPLDDDRHAVLVVGASTETDVRRRFADDPWARSGILEIESVQSWRVWLGGTRLGG